MNLNFYIGRLLVCPSPNQVDSNFPLAILQIIDGLLLSVCLRFKILKMRVGIWSHPLNSDHWNCEEPLLNDLVEIINQRQVNWWIRGSGFISLQKK